MGHAKRQFEFFFPSLVSFIFFLSQLELETTLRQESEAKFNLARTNLENKVASLEKENIELKAVSRRQLDEFTVRRYCPKKGGKDNDQQMPHCNGNAT